MDVEYHHFSYVFQKTKKRVRNSKSRIVTFVQDFHCFELIGFAHVRFSALNFPKKSLTPVGGAPQKALAVPQVQCRTQARGCCCHSCSRIHPGTCCCSCCCCCRCCLQPLQLPLPLRQLGQVQKLCTQLTKMPPKVMKRKSRAPAAAQRLCETQ